MAQTNGSEAANGGQAGAQSEAPQIQARVVAQYIKDLSFENPNVDKLIGQPGEKPNMSIQVNVNARRVKDDLFESEIDFKGHATNDQGTIYDIELIYAGLFQIRQIPEEAMEPFLLINCPSLLFPFLRRIVADISREGGFPPLMLDPIDFAGLYMSRKREQQSQGAGGETGQS